MVHPSPTASCAAPSRSTTASGYSVKNGSPFAMPPPPGIRAWTRAASSVVVSHMLNGLKLADRSAWAGLKHASSRPMRWHSAAVRISSSASPLGSMTMTVPGPRIASDTISSSSRVLPLLVVPPISTCPTSSLHGSTSGRSLFRPTACSAGWPPRTSRPTGSAWPLCR